jgi:hypothetical protein
VKKSLIFHNTVVYYRHDLNISRFHRYFAFNKPLLKINTLIMYYLPSFQECFLLLYYSSSRRGPTGIDYWYRGVTVLLLGYLEVNVIFQCKSPHWAVDLCPHCRSLFHWGKWHNSTSNLKPNHNQVTAAPKQASLKTTSSPYHHVTPKQNYCM